jgi:hypothetical protein
LINTRKKRPSRARRLSTLAVALPAAGISAVAVVAVVAAIAPQRQPGPAAIPQWQAGDVLCLSVDSWRSDLVRLFQLGRTRYSHVGLVVVQQGQRRVIHADPTRGRVVNDSAARVLTDPTVTGGAVYRAKELTSRQTAAIVQVARNAAKQATPFDNAFKLTTSHRLYCTELIWRAYRNAGINLVAEPGRPDDYLTPARLIDSDQLTRVHAF